MTNIRTISDTIPFMTSESSDDKLVAEFYQLEFRIKELKDYMTALETGKIDHNPRCGYDCLRVQLKTMLEYRKILADRAMMCGIIL